ncbi:helix-turn-helix domain-containing protein [Nocardia terpenica]|uniref:helix-turn-helix domain-containing protein n=1 Tax=Nocardia terpenica TaxID=455432 RepID=UPI00189318AC|nr:helix-turn-helix domain-containing protein [Nocardia terpenica]MBF6060565.1 helix-turn-helix domain-containing protein [Nocardia terpenica]MBF6103825.1 helix-turn-helix domain-containing protein [Nocardia terpenica]MBF6111801.1 helix-turn-helix domain-containing protein [Nocardia terpenica]MBF6118046.1 helix-turn-helix domain-containing protein [Nocardia terpenica]MBF6155228.1 helix-turn-helix domain-containing protein [Nocardia terpenica]
MATINPADATEADRLNAAVAEVVRDRREQKGLTRDDVCSATGIALNTYIRYETGATAPNTGLLHEIAKALGTTVVGIINAARRSSGLDEPAPLGATEPDMAVDYEFHPLTADQVADLEARESPDTEPGA